MTAETKKALISFGWFLFAYLLIALTLWEGGSSVRELKPAESAILFMLALIYSQK